MGPEEASAFDTLGLRIGWIAFLLTLSPNTIAKSNSFNCETPNIVIRACTEALSNSLSHFTVKKQNFRSPQLFSISLSHFFVRKRFFPIYVHLSTSFLFRPMNNFPLSVLSLVAMYRGGLESSLCFSGVVWHALIQTIKCIWTTAGFYFESTNMKKPLHCT